MACYVFSLHQAMVNQKDAFGLQLLNVCDLELRLFFIAAVIIDKIPQLTCTTKHQRGMPAQQLLKVST